jgi:hypothetical protein
MRFARRAGMVSLFFILSWLSCAFWNSVKPMPPGTHVTSLPVRLAESQVDFIDDSVNPGATLQHALAAVGRANQMILLDDCPLSEQLAEQLVMRRRQRPNLKIVLVTDPRNEIYGGTPAHLLSAMEQAGIIVARTRLERLRDSNPLYSSLWRLTMGWWSDAFDDTPGEITRSSQLRMRNFKADERHVLIADDGAGGWMSLVMSAVPHNSRRLSNVGLEIRGHLARDIGASELQVASWSVDDERLPTAPPIENRGVGTIDARFLTEGAIETALRDVLAVAGSGDLISVVGRVVGDRPMIDALLRACARGAHLQALIDPDLPRNRAVAGELMRLGMQNIEVRWQTDVAQTDAGFVLIRHRSDAWLDLGSANFTRRGLNDLNLAAAVELHMPARAAPARAAAEFFSREWSRAATYAEHADQSADTYWRYRLSEATGLALF